MPVRNQTKFDSEGGVVIIHSKNEKNKEKENTVITSKANNEIESTKMYRKNNNGI